MAVSMEWTECLYYETKNTIVIDFGHAVAAVIHMLVLLSNK